MKENAVQSEEILEEPPTEIEELNDIDLGELARRYDWRDVLRNIVEKEDMDPWDVNVSKLVKEYVKTVKEMKEIDFKIPANAILASSILLRKKSSSWVLKEEEEEEFDAWEEVPVTPDQIPPAREEIPELKPKKRETKRKVSVDELIDAVEDVIDKEKEKAKEKVKEKESVQEEILPQQLLDMAKVETEDFEEKIEEIETKIVESIDSENLTRFSEITEDQESSEDIVNNLIPVLHLADKGKISIWQEQVFGDIFIHYIEEGGS